MRLIDHYRSRADIEGGAITLLVKGSLLSRLGVSSKPVQKAAEVEGFISGHSFRVGSAVSLAQAGASVVDMQNAGRWKSPQMPAHYAKAELAERGPVARFFYGTGK